MHPWFVVNDRGSLSRWEILFRSNAGNKTSWGHLHKDFLPPFKGLGVLPYFENYFAYEGVLLGYNEGEAAMRMGKFIENSPETYPFSFKFSLTGPNSNTYAQWVLNSFPESNLKLPWNSFGKNYHMVK